MPELPLSGQINGRRRANKRLKFVAHLCALSAIRQPGESMIIISEK